MIKGMKIVDPDQLSGTQDFCPGPVVADVEVPLPLPERRGG
jgi:hypothetical protein